MNEYEHIEGMTLCPCRRCGSDRWNVWTSWAGSYITAYAVCEKCDALYFSSGDDTSKARALKALSNKVNNGHPPY